MGTFTNGLDPVIRTEVFSMQAVGLEDIIDATQLAKKKIEKARNTQGPYTREVKTD